MQPEESLQAALDLRARRLAPVHWGKFTEAAHAWSEPVRRMSILAAKVQMPLLTPEIGQLIDLNAMTVLPPWWEGVR